VQVEGELHESQVVLLTPKNGTRQEVSARQSHGNPQDR
jgi:hypothetical protein